MGRAHLADKELQDIRRGKLARRHAGPSDGDQRKQLHSYPDLKLEDSLCVRVLLREDSEHQPSGRQMGRSCALEECLARDDSNVGATEEVRQETEGGEAQT